MTAPARLEFPRDHGAHPGFRIEWWYVTANLTGPDGRDYGVQWTLFRQATTPDAERPGWASNQIWMGHAALTTPEAHRYAETFARGGIGTAGVQAEPFRAWIDDWEVVGAAGPGDALARLRVTANGADFAYDLALASDLPPVPQGENGFSVKSEAGQASYYYSQPFYTVKGTLTVDDAAIPVTGRAWFDREWSSQPLTETQEGWDWFSLHLDAGARVMLYRFRDSARPPYYAGTWIAADGTPTPLRSDQIMLSPGGSEAVAGRDLPVSWRVAIPDFGLAVDTQAVQAQSWMGTVFPYWEGPIRFSGSHTGRGYLEMVGYE